MQEGRADVPPREGERAIVLAGHSWKISVREREMNSGVTVSDGAVKCAADRGIPSDPAETQLFLICR